MFSVNVLLFGPHVALAKRCLGSIVRTADWSRISDVRIGLNDVEDATLAEAKGFAAAARVPCYLYHEETHTNVFKYPLMRRMLYDAERPVSAEHVMWFDDDSYITGDQTWWSLVADRARKVDLLGSIYLLTGGFRPGQIDGIKRQGWYNGKPIEARPRFVTGGWWVARMRVLAAWNYPFPELKNNGGDSLLGQLIQQQGLVMSHFNTGVAINYDAKHGESRAKRRGVTTVWPWQRGQTDSFAHQCFDVTVTRYEGTDHAV